MPVGSGFGVDGMLGMSVKFGGGTLSVDSVLIEGSLPLNLLSDLIVMQEVAGQVCVWRARSVDACHPAGMPHVRRGRSDWKHTTSVSHSKESS